MKGITADVNIQRQWQIVLGHLVSDRWREIWDSLGLQSETFATLGLSPDAPDEAVWMLCQARQVVLITNNRNARGPTSLHSAIVRLNSRTSLPVFTIGDSDRVLESPAYADFVAERLLEYLLDIDRVRGTGRLYIP